MRKIAVVTGSRADYGLLKNLIKKLQTKLPDTMLFATGEHFIDPAMIRFKEDNLIITELINCLSKNDSYAEMANAISEGIHQFTQVYTKYKPNLVVVLGDRYEIFAATVAAYVLKIPIAHLHGGEVTHGALDDGFRHSISKMASLHFVAHDFYKQRLIKMGEEPSRIYTVGAIGLDNLKTDFSLDNDDLWNRYPSLKNQKYFLLTLHPSTLSYEKYTYQTDCLIQALEVFKDFKIVVTRSNYDPDGYSINKIWEEWTKKNNNVLFVPVLGDDYLRIASFSSVVIGNSSSGILEVPYLNIPVVNIGNRQDGRIFPKGVFCVDFDKNKIIYAIQDALSFDKESEQIYGKAGIVTQNVYNILIENLDNTLIYKKFYDA